MRLPSVDDPHHNIGGWVMRALSIATRRILPLIATALFTTTALAGSSAIPTSITHLFESAATDSEVPATPANLLRQVVEYSSREAPGTVIIDTPHTYLYLVLGSGKAVR